MNGRHIRSWKTRRGLKNRYCRVLEAATQQAHMERFEVGPAVQVCRGNRHKIDFLVHNSSQCVAVVFGPCIANSCGSLPTASSSALD